jgi:hypothetical protein
MLNYIYVIYHFICYHDLWIGFFIMFIDQFYKYFIAVIISFGLYIGLFS